MPAGPIGSCWASGSWADTAWEANTWAGSAVVIVPRLRSTLSFGEPTVHPDVRPRIRRSGASLAAVLIAAEGDGWRSAGGEAIAAALSLGVAALGAKSIRGSQMADAGTIASVGRGVGVDLELLAALAIARALGSS